MLRPDELIYPRGTRIRPLTTKENVGSSFLDKRLAFELDFYQLDKNTVLYYLIRTHKNGEYSVCCCTSVRLGPLKADDISEPGYIKVSPSRYTILNIGIDEDFRDFFLGHLLLFLVAVKACSEQYHCIYVDHPALSAIDFFVNLGFVPNQSTASTDTTKYWSNEDHKIKRGCFAFLYKEEDLYRQGLLHHVTAFQELHTPTGTERHQCNWFCDSSRLYGHLRAKVKKIFEFSPPEFTPAFLPDDIGDLA
ncbi:hypothetical protein [Candidatus Sororendozoicomonas aggregata]|uniref:hypothetical protein n=1 Tax=Candidatus Sororendozoicomonas aggregata TaxID=3073239 RepID=UPI002ED53CB2